MTEKRFTKCDTKIRDNGEEMTQAEVRDMLNALHEENKKLKEENKQLNHDLDLYEENNTNEVLNNLRIELTSRMNDCIEEFKE